MKVNELSAVYNQFDFTGDVRVGRFLQRFLEAHDAQGSADRRRCRTNTTRTLDGGKTYLMYDQTNQQIRGRHIWALKKINGTWRPPEDWTTSAYEAMCLDKASERVESLVLIMSNGNYTTSRTSGMEDNAIDALGDQKARLVASKTPCWKYKGFNDASLTYDDGTDHFTIATHAAATYVGQPNYSSVDLTRRTRDPAPGLDVPG